MADSRKTFCLFFDVYFLLHKNKQDLYAIFFTFNDSDLYISAAAAEELLKFAVKSHAFAKA